MTDEFALRDAAKDLLGLYVQLDRAKYAANQPKGERVMRAAPGPRPPAPDAIISLDEELVSRLFEMVSEVRNHIRPSLILTKYGPRLCSFVAFNAQAISELDVAPDLLEEIHDQAHQINKRINPPDTAEVANRPEPRQDATHITRRLITRGRTATTDQVRKWAERGHITRVERADGKATYLMSEVLKYLESRDAPEPAEVL